MESTRAFLLLEQCQPLLGVVAFIAGALWAGILFSVSWLSGRTRWMADGTEIGSLAIALNRRWGTPCEVVFLSAGFLWAYTRPAGAVLDVPWAIGLSVALAALLVVHWRVRGRALRVAGGNTSATRGEGMSRLALVLSLAALTTLVGLRIGW